MVKRADGDDVERLRAEAERLRRASHPGVIQVLSSAASPNGWELRTAHAGRSLEAAGPLTVAQVAALVAAVATTLADLHAAGIVHGRVEPSHVLLGDNGRPVLCGFGMDPGGVQSEPSDDVAGIGAIVVSLLGTEAEVEPIPDRRWHSRRGWTGWERRALLTLADQACAEPVTTRPSARRLAAAIGEAVPTELIANAAMPRPDHDRMLVTDVADPLDALRASATIPVKRPKPRAIPVMLAAIGVAALVVAVQRPGVDPVSSAHESAASSVAPGPPHSTEEPSAPSTTLALCGPIGGVDIDGDGCGEAVVVDGQLVTVGADRFQVGDRGDQVVVRDWDCDGQPTPAIFRPGTGEVFIFPGWDADAAVVVEPIATVIGGTGLVVAPASVGCSGLAVRTPDSVVDVVRRPA